MANSVLKWRRTPSFISLSNTVRLWLNKRIDFIAKDKNQWLVAKSTLLRPFPLAYPHWKSTTYHTFISSLRRITCGPLKKSKTFWWRCNSPNMVPLSKKQPLKPHLLQGLQARRQRSLSLSPKEIPAVPRRNLLETRMSQLWSAKASFK